ncbi:hypothetical protein LPB67_05895 [Undibacterium sp. Jales W-56]|uniref:hypothetical protein n=1 Tax=Undibacterium sp. Jales W-56 TaxID=2897325 RepID=UPI0021D1D69F|nr:hypothetical protein [Undibacterium sp. Jales W-56]MCU6433310.1 hypothetical protein [Undibacterium sp. Jales W-56]
MNEKALEAIVARQKPGAKFVVSAEMLGMSVPDFDLQAKRWMEEDGPGFTTTGVPFRRVIDGQFLIQRLTLLKDA